MARRCQGVLRRGDNLRSERSLAIAGGDELVVQLVEFLLILILLGEVLINHQELFQVLLLVRMQ